MSHVLLLDERGDEPLAPDHAATAGGEVSNRSPAAARPDEAHLNELGYDAERCLIDFGETAETVLRERLAKQSFDCVMVGAGVRLIAQNTFLFEKLVNIVHAGAPQAKFRFNTMPADTAAAVQRWFPAP